MGGKVGRQDNSTEILTTAESLLQQHCPRMSPPNRSTVTEKVKESAKRKEGWKRDAQEDMTVEVYNRCKLYCRETMGKVPIEEAVTAHQHPHPASGEAEARRGCGVPTICTVSAPGRCARVCRLGYRCTSFGAARDHPAVSVNERHAERGRPTRTQKNKSFTKADERLSAFLFLPLNQILQPPGSLSHSCSLSLSLALSFTHWLSLERRED